MTKPIALEKKHLFFRRFISFDCQDENTGWDAAAIQWFSPTDMERVLRRLWFFGGVAHGMDIAEDCGEGGGIKGGKWGIAAGACLERGSNAKQLEPWIAYVRKDSVRDCLLSISYSVPETVLELFTGKSVVGEET